MMLRRTALFLGALACMVPLASANVIRLTVTGNITNSNMGAFPAGQPMTVTMTYESSGAPQLISNNQAFYVDHIISVNMTSGSYNSTYSTGQFGQSNKYNSLQNTDGISFEVAAVQGSYAFTNPKPRVVQMSSVVSNGVTQTFAALAVQLASSQNTLWSDYNLPVGVNSALLDQNRSVNVGFSGGSFGMTGATVTLTDITASRIPVLTSVSPTNAAVSQALTLTVNGSGFAAGDTVCWSSPFTGIANCTAPTTFVSGTQLTAVIPASQLAPAGIGTVHVATSAQVFSGPATVTLSNAPTISSLSPASAQAGGPAFTLSVAGTGFVTGSTVEWNGVARTTTFVNANTLTAGITAADIAAAANAQITVSTPLPLRSQPFGFTVTPQPSPVPTLSAISPSSAQFRGPAFSLLVTGTNFVPGSVVRWNGAARETSYVSSTQLAALITSNDLGSGSASVTVFNPAPGGGVTGAIGFIVVNATPVINVLSPAAGTAGGNGFTMSVSGSNFVQSSNVQWNGSSRTTSFVSATQLLATIPNSDLANEGTASVTVVTPSTGGGTSNVLGYSVGPATGGNGIPTVTSFTPATIPAGSAGFTLTVNGTNFTSGSVVRWNGQNRNTTFVSATQLTAFVYADDLPGAGIGNISVFNPPPGGGSSNSSSFTVSAAVVNPSPVVDTPIPSLVYSGAGGFTITIAGTGFVPGSVVRWNGANLVTTFLSALSVSAVVPASLVAANGTGSVVVFSPAPGGGLSPAFTVRIVSAPSSNPVPTVTGFFPTSWTAGAIDFILKITGTGFVPGSTVVINGRTHATTFVSDTLLWVAMTLADSVASGNLQVTVSNPAPGGGASPVSLFSVLAAPIISNGGIINAASLDPSQLSAAYGIGALFGANFSVDTVLTSTVPWPRTLAGVTLRINGILARLLYVTPGQLGFQFPSELAGLTTLTAQVTVNGVSSAEQTITLSPFSPGVFTMNQSGSGQGAVLIAGTATLAAAPGSVAGQVCLPVPKSGFISIYMTGLGPVDNPPANGAAGGSDPLSRTLTLPTVTIGGVNAPVLFSGLAPSLVGVYQINAQVPESAPSGSSVSVVVSIGGATARPVTIAIQ